MDPARLAGMREVMAGHVERGAAPGMAWLIARRGEVHAEAIGQTAVGGSEPMRRDTIFRIASMTKPMIAAAAMLLVEECRLRLDDAVERWLPELSSRQVLRRVDGPLDDTVPAARAITVRDLLTFRMGFGSMGGPADRCPIQRAAAAEGLGAFGLPQPATEHDPDEWMRRFGKLPLMHQPGEKWMYHTSFEVLGVLLARVAGKPLGEFLRERLFEPLGMRDTGFWVPAEKLGRLASCYRADPGTGGLELLDGPVDSWWANAPVFPSAGGGLVSTLDDCLAFGSMMLQDGKHGSERVLSRAAVEFMRTDQLTEKQKAISDFVPGFWNTHGWGIGVCVTTGRDSVAENPGRFGWDGGYGTSWCTDPKEEMVAILMTQRMGFPRIWAPYLDFWTSVYQAIGD